MNRSRFSHKISSRIVLGALVFALAATALPAMAQSYCQNWTETLLDTSNNCVSDPRRDRAFGVETFTWKGHDYLMLNRGNELEIYNIDDPSRPIIVDQSKYDFGTAGDSDYDLLAFDVCNDCRYAAFAHKVKYMVVIDLGTGLYPQFAGYSTYQSPIFGGMVFKHAGQDYVIMAQESLCGGNSGLFIPNGTSNLGLVQCLEAGGNPLSVRMGQSLHVGAATYLYLGENRSGQAYVFRVNGSGTATSLTHTATPSGMKAYGHALAIDENNLIAASADFNANDVGVWDLANPGQPTLMYSIDHKWASNVAMASAGSGVPPVLAIVAGSDINSAKLYLIKSSGPEPVDNEFWGDPSEPHNAEQACALDMDAALSPTGDTFYWSRYSLSQVFDISQCVDAGPATAGVDVSPVPVGGVFPGSQVTVKNVSFGSYDRWAVWATAQPSGATSGFPTPSATNPQSFQLTIPQNLATGVTYLASVEVESDELVPQQALATAAVTINRSPLASFTVTPEAVIVGESVNLAASVTGGIPAKGPTDVAAYRWQVFAPGSTTPVVYTGANVSGLALTTAGDWLVKLKVNYLHGSTTSDPDGDGLYEALSEKTIKVTSVAAAFTVTPAAPLNTQPITLNGSASKPVGGNLSFFWQIDGPSVYTCPASPICEIQADALAWGSYTITLTVTNLNDYEESTVTKPLAVGDGAIQPIFTWAPGSPEIGQIATFTIGGVEVAIDKATWNMGGTGCDGASATQVCTPGQFAGCEAKAFKYASSGNKIVSLTIEVGGVSYIDERPAAERTVTVANSGSCSGIVPPPPTCSYSLGAYSAKFGPSGGTGSFTVQTTSSCKWTASDNASWITITSGASGTGTGTVRYSVATNTGAQRTASITAGGRVYTVTQEAPYVPANFTMSNPYPDIGETVTFEVDPILEVESWDFGDKNCKGIGPVIDCTWLPAGSCNSFQWTFPTAGQKSVTMHLVDGRTQTKPPVVQDRGECCRADQQPFASFAMSAEEAHVGETVVFTDTSGKSLATKALGFGWAPSDPEIGEKVLFTLTGLTGEVSKATWNFGDTGCAGAGQTQICIPDQWNTCTSMSFTYADSGAKTVSVAVELVVGGNVNAGPSTVTVANAGTCGGGGGGGCSYTITPLSRQFGAGGGVGEIAVNTTNECSWSATTTNAWLSVTPGSGTGSGTVTYTVDQYLGTSLRSGSIKIENKSHTVRQDPVAPETDSDPTAWLWTVSLFTESGGSQTVATSTDQVFSYVFKEPGTYFVELEASNCVGSTTDAKTIEIIESLVEDFVVGAAVRLAGANETQWETDFRFHNPCGEPLDVRIEYEPEGTNNTDQQLMFREFELAANETRIFADIVEAIPGLAGEERTGSVRIESSSGSGCKVLSVSRTFNDTPEGSLGLFVPALPVKRNGTNFLDLTGLNHNSDYRTNLRLVNYSDVDVWVPLSLYDRNGNQLGQGRSTLVPGHSTKQVNEVAAWLGVEGDIAPFSVRADVTGVDVQAFATVVDNITGDSVLFLSSFKGENRIWLVGVASLEGVNNSQWRTDMWLYNPTGDWLAGEVEFVVGESPSDVFGFTWPTLGEHRIKQYLDIVGDELNLSETRGYIVLTGADDGPAPQVAARTYNLDPAGGTAGLNLRAFGSDDLLYPGETGFVVGISNSADQNIGFRTNLGLLNTDRDHWTGVRLTLIDVTGAQVGEPMDMMIAPGVLRQFDVAKKFGVSGVTASASLKIEVTEGGGVAAYATEIDNRTQDSIYIPAQRKFMGAAR